MPFQDVLGFLLLFMDVIHQKQRAKELQTSQLGGERGYADAKNQLFYGGVQINTGEVVSSLFAHFKLKRTKQSETSRRKFILSSFTETSPRLAQGALEVKTEEGPAKLTTPYAPL